MLLTKSSHVCIQCINPVLSRVCLTKVRYFAFFGSEIKKNFGVDLIHIFKSIPHIILISNVCGYFGLTPKLLLKYHFWHFLFFHFLFIYFFFGLIQGKENV